VHWKLNDLSILLIERHRHILYILLHHLHLFSKLKSSRFNLIKLFLSLRWSTHDWRYWSVELLTHHILLLLILLRHIKAPQELLGNNLLLILRPRLLERGLLRIIHGLVTVVCRIQITTDCGISWIQRMIHHIWLLKNLRWMRPLIWISKEGIQKLENLSLYDFFISTLSLEGWYPWLLSRKVFVLYWLPVRLSLYRNRWRIFILIKSLSVWATRILLKVFGTWLRFSMLLCETNDFINTHILDWLVLLLTIWSVHSWV
jgi:hypothetical protein